MKKSGFTLVELLAVVALIAIISIMGTYGITAVQKQINANLWASTVEMVERAAINFGEDNLTYMKYKVDNDCTVDSVVRRPCLTIPVRTLINKNYITAKDKTPDNLKALKNDSLDPSDPCYYIGDTEAAKVYIYLDSNISSGETLVFAKYKGCN